MTSIRRRLTAAVAGSVALLAIALGTALYLHVRTVLILQFDAALGAETRALASLIREGKDGALDFEFTWDMVPEYLPSEHAAYFHIRGRDGTTIVRSRSLGAGELPALTPAGDGPALRDLPLPGGRPGRALAIRFVPRPEAVEDADEDAGVNTVRCEAPPGKGPVTLVVACGREGIDRTLRVLLSSLLASAAALCLGATGLTAWVVRAGLRPLDRVARQAAAIDAPSLGARFPVDDMPGELRPICARLNDLLDRLRAAFEREKRFSADAAHELRTPIAELRAMAEVAVKFPPSDAEAVQWARDALSIARQMETLVAALISLARCESGQQPVEAGTTDLAGAVRHTLNGLEARAAARKLRLRLDTSGDATLRTDATKLSAILSNVLGNAVEHCPEGGDIACRISTGRDGVSLEVENSNDTLTPEDLRHLFEPFWKKDRSRSRSGEGGLGLGLTLVAAYAKLLGAAVDCRLTSDRRFSLSVRFPLSAPGRPAPVDATPRD